RRVELAKADRRPEAGEAAADDADVDADGAFEPARVLPGVRLRGERLLDPEARPAARARGAPAAKAPRTEHASTTPRGGRSPARRRGVAGGGRPRPPPPRGRRGPRGGARRRGGPGGPRGGVPRRRRRARRPGPAVNPFAPRPRRPAPTRPAGARDARRSGR